MAIKKYEGFSTLLEEPRVDIEELKRLSMNGCPDELRPLVWKLLLNLLPLKRSAWASAMKTSRNYYQNYIREFAASSTASSVQDHPLSTEPNSRWAEFFQDNEMLLQINKDCKRLYPDLNFFQQTTNYPFGGLEKEFNAQNSLRKRIENSLLESESWNKNRNGLNVIVKKNTSKPRYKHIDLECYEGIGDNQEMHWEVAQRILFIYCKTNKAHGYVQGMNEIIGPLYYVFANDPNEEEREFAEADTFYCFIETMRDVQPLFIKSLDADHMCGIQYRLKQFMTYLKNIDIELVNKLEEIKLLPEYYAFRWVTLYLSREFTLPDVIRLWDTLFSVKNRLDFMIYACCALIVVLKQDLMDSNFAQAMDLVQNVQTSQINIDDVMRKGLEYYLRFGDS